MYKRLKIIARVAVTDKLIITQQIKEDLKIIILVRKGIINK